MHGTRHPLSQQRDAIKAAQDKLTAKHAQELADISAASQREVDTVVAELRMKLNLEHDTLAITLRQRIEDEGQGQRRKLDAEAHALKQKV